jgi:DNA helicase IV
LVWPNFEHNGSKISNPVSEHPELDAERIYLEHAHERVEELRESARSAMADVMDLGKGGTFQHRTERDVVVRSSLARLEQLDIGNQPLCFGRIDETQGDRFYIGRMGVSSRDQEPLVVDWRAPVAEPFYRATGRFPMGISRRRHFQFEGRRLVAIEDEPLLVDPDGDNLPLAGKGALLASLERSRSGRMGDIVATIQGEQDEVIRSSLPGVQIVQGGPGTGKTAVALHRAAYLLYTHRFPLERQGVLVVGPNPVFLRYIGHVLPSLGESGVTLSTISRLVPDAPLRSRELPAVGAIKGDIKMAKFIGRAVKNRQRPLKANLLLSFGPYNLVFTAADSKELVATMKRRGGTHNARRKRLERLVVERLYGRYTGAVERARNLDASISEVELSRFHEMLREVPAFGEAMDRMWPKLLPTELVHDLLGAKPLVALAGKGILTNEEVELLVRRRSTALEDIPWTDADMALIDEARVLLGPVKPLAENEQLIPAYGHIVVDEAQDLSPMQLRMLARRSIGGSMTMVGDIAQATGPWAPSNWGDVIGYLPTNWKTREVELTIGYRTPAEAMTPAAKVLALTGLGLTPPRPVRNSGEDPVVVQVDVSQLVKETAAHTQRESLAVSEGSDAGTVAVIAPDALVDEVAGAMTAANMKYGTVGNKALESTVTLLSASAAKGLEFDSVIVVEPDAIAREGVHGPRSLYVALTRTTRRLSVLHTGTRPDYLD